MNRRLAICLMSLLFCLLPACQQQMGEQPSYRPLQSSTFFPDGRSSRPLVAGTVARGHGPDDAWLRQAVAEPMREPAQVAALLGLASRPGPGLVAAAAGSSRPELNYVKAFPF